MTKISMKYFMRENLKQDEIIEVPGISTFCGEDGKPIPLQIKVLGVETINQIRKSFTKSKIVMDERGKRVLDQSGAPIIREETDGAASMCRMMVEALVVPDLRDPELMSFYGAHDVNEMPMKVFRNPRDYAYVSTEVAKALGMGEPEPSDEELIAAAKN